VYYLYFQGEEIKREKITHVLTIKENHCSFFYKSHVLLQLELQLEHSGNVYALQYYSDYVAYLLCMKILLSALEQIQQRGEVIGC